MMSKNIPYYQIKYKGIYFLTALNLVLQKRSFNRFCL